MTMFSVERQNRQDVDSGTDSTRSDYARGIAIDRAPRRKTQSIYEATDEEGTLDVWKDCVKTALRSKNSTTAIEIDIEEPDSVDWEAERSVLPAYLIQLEQQHSFVPRIGELVLWQPFIPKGHYLMLEPQTSTYQYYSFHTQSFIGHPKWRGGVITSAPIVSSENERIDFEDILDTGQKKIAVNKAGFRVETMPDPNEDQDKSLSKQYRFLPLQNIRPLSQWQLLLKGIPQAELHPSILFALTCMTLLSLVDKWRFIGDWPTGTILAKGLYLGSELITIGDAVRIKPNMSDGRVLNAPNVVVVDSIRLHLKNCLPGHTTAESPLLCSKSFITLTGIGYTMNIENAGTHLPMDAETVKQEFRPVGSHQFGSWYPVHDITSERYEVSYDEILGRLYEPDAIRLWTGCYQNKQPAMNGDSMPQKRLDLFFDAASILAARKYASQTDARLPEPQLDAYSPTSSVSWFLADSRGQGLSIASSNGVELAAYHTIRTPATVRTWRTWLKIAKGEKVTSSMWEDLQPYHWQENGDGTTTLTRRTRGRPPGSKMFEGKLYTAEQWDAMNMSSSDRLKTNENVARKQGSRRRQRQSTSQMAEAALEVADSDEDDDFILKPSRGSEGRKSSSHSKRQDNLTTQTFNIHRDDRTSNVTVANNSDRQTDSPLTLAQVSQFFGVPSTDPRLRFFVDTRPPVNSPVPELDVSDSDIARSEADDGDDEDENNGESGSDFEARYEEEEYDEYDNDSWDDPRNARGGTEETEGGDYVP